MTILLFTILLLFCGFAAILCFMILPGESNLDQRRPFWGANIAHRGLHNADKTIPENSLAAFAAAVDSGYAIELDLQLSKDGEVVVFHDDDLQRVCRTEGRVDSRTIKELKALRLEHTNEKIPTLREVLKVVDCQVPLVIELKTGPQNKMLCQRSWRILRQYDGDICIESFDPRILYWFKKNVPGLLRGQLSAPPRHLPKNLSGFVVGTLLCNFIGRPHFIAYMAGKQPFTVRLANRLAMRIAWTILPDMDIKQLAAQNDALIFELYEPPTHFKDAPEKDFYADDSLLYHYDNPSEKPENKKPNKPNDT